MCAKKDLDKGDFVAEYVGDMLATIDGENRLIVTEDEENPRSYIYFFQHKNKKLWLVGYILCVACSNLFT